MATEYKLSHTAAEIDRKLSTSVDSVSDQTITGVKTFENGITMGTPQENVQFIYDNTEGALRISFSQVESKAINE